MHDLGSILLCICRAKTPRRHAEQIRDLAIIQRIGASSRDEYSGTDSIVEHLPSISDRGSYVAHH